MEAISTRQFLDKYRDLGFNIKSYDIKKLKYYGLIKTIKFKHNIYILELENLPLILPTIEEILS